jgi:hypothetical protein
MQLFVRLADWLVVGVAVSLLWSTSATGILIARIRFGHKDRLEVLRKYYLGLPFRVLRNVSRRLRQPFKDRMQKSFAGAA